MKKITLVFKDSDALNIACEEAGLPYDGDNGLNAAERNDWYERTQRFMNGEYLYVDVYENGRYELRRYNHKGEPT